MSPATFEEKNDGQSETVGIARRPVRHGHRSGELANVLGEPGGCGWAGARAQREVANDIDCGAS
jgi:hypothetical protein